MNNVVKYLWPFAYADQKNTTSVQNQQVGKENFDDSDVSSGIITNYYSNLPSVFTYGQTFLSSGVEVYMGIFFHLVISFIAAYLVFKELKSNNTTLAVCILGSFCGFIFSTYTIIMYLIYIVFTHGLSTVNNMSTSGIVKAESTSGSVKKMSSSTGEFSGNNLSSGISVKSTPVSQQYSLASKTNVIPSGDITTSVAISE